MEEALSKYAKATANANKNYKNAVELENAIFNGDRRWPMLRQRETLKSAELTPKTTATSRASIGSTETVKDSSTAKKTRETNNGDCGVSDSN